MPAYGEGNIISTAGDTTTVNRYSGFSSTILESFSDPTGTPVFDSATTSPDPDLILSDSDVYFRFSGFSSVLVNSFSAVGDGFTNGIAWRENEGIFVHDEFGGLSSETYRMIQMSGFTSTVTDSFDPHGDVGVDRNRHSITLGRGNPWLQWNTNSGTQAYFNEYSGFTSTVRDSFTPPPVSAGNNPIYGDWTAIQGDPVGNDPEGEDVLRFSAFTGSKIDEFQSNENVDTVTWDNFEDRNTTANPEGVKYRAEFQNHNRSWRVDVRVSGYSGEILDRFVQRNLKLTWGDPNSKQRNTVLPSHGRIQMDDEDGSLFDDINGKPDEDLKVDVYSLDGNFDWTGEIRTDTVKRLLNPNTDLPVVDFYAYDGLKGQNDVPFPVETDRTVTEKPLGTEIFTTILIDGAQDLSIDFVHSWFGVNVDPDGNQLDDLALDTFNRADAIGDRTAGEIFATTQGSANMGDDTIQVDQFGPLKPGQKATIGLFGSNFEVIQIEQTREQPDGDLIVEIAGTFTNSHSSNEPVKPFALQKGFGSPYIRGEGSQLDMLEDLAGQLGLRVWEGFDGRWKVMRDISLGESIPTGPDLLTYDADTDTLSEAGSSLSADQPSVTNDDWERSAVRRILQKLVKMSVDKQQTRGDSNPVRDPGLELGPNPGENSSPWLPLRPTIRRNEDGAATGEWSLEIDNEGQTVGPKATVRQYIEWLGPEVGSISMSIFQNTAAAGQVAATNRIRLYLWGRDGTKWYINADGEWQNSETSIPKDQIGVFNPGFFMDINESPPIEGLLVLEYESEDDDGVLIDDVRVRPETSVNVRDTGDNHGRKVEVQTELVNTAGAHIRAQQPDASWDQVAGWYPNSPNWLRGVLLSPGLAANVLATATGPNQSGNPGSAYQHSGFSATVQDSFSTQGEDSVDIEWDGQDTLIAVDTEANVTGGYDLLSGIQGALTAATSGGNVLSTNQEPIGGGGGAGTSGADFGSALQGSVYRHSGFNATQTDSFSSPTGPSSVSWDGSDTHILGDVVYKMSGFSNSIKDSFNILNDPTDLSVQADGDLIIRLRTPESHVLTSGFSNTVVDSFSTGMTGGCFGLTWGENGVADIHNPSFDLTGNSFFRQFSEFSGTITDSFSTPSGSGPSEGISFKSGDLLTQTTGNQEVLRCSAFSDTVTDSFSTVEGGDGLESNNLNERTGQSSGGGSPGSTRGSYLKHSAFSGTVTDSFSAPDNLPTAITWTGQDAIAADENADTFYRHSAFTSAVTDSFSSANDLPYGASWDGTNLLSTAAASGGGGTTEPKDAVVSQYNADIIHYSGFTNTVQTSFSAPGGDPVGLDWDGDDLINADESTNTVYKLSGVTSTVKDSFSGPGSDIHGITLDANGDYYISEPGDSDLEKLDGFSSTVLQNLFAPTIEGLSFDTSDLYAANTEDGRHEKRSGFSSTITDSFAIGDIFSGSAWTGTNYQAQNATNDRIVEYSGFSGTVADSFSIGYFAVSNTWLAYQDRTGATLGGGGVGVSHLKHSAFTATILDSYSAPLSDPKGLVWTDGDVKSLDGTGRALRHSGFSATVTSSFSTPGTDPEGVSQNGTGLLSEDTTNQTHYQHSAFSSTITDSYSTPGSSPWGMEWDNLNARLSQAATDIKGTHLKHSGFSDTILDSYSTPGTIPTGMAWDSSDLLSADSDLNKHLKHSGFTNTVQDSYSYVSDNPNGMSYDGTDVYSVNGNLAVILRHSGFSATIDDSFSSADTAPQGVVYEFGDILEAGADSEGHFKHSGFSASVLDSYSTPANDPTGMSWDGDDVLWIAQGNDTHFRQSGFSATVADSYSAPGTDPWGIDTDNLSNRASLATQEGVIFKHSAFSASIKDSFFSPGPDPSGVAEDGDVFTADNDNAIESIYRHSGFSTTVTDSFSFSNNSALGWDGDLITSKFSEQVVRHHSGFSATVDASFTAPAQFTLIDGVGKWGDTVLVYDEGTDSHHRFDGFTDTVLDSYSTPYDRGAGLTVDFKDARLGTSGGGATQFSYSTETGLDNIELREIILGPLTDRAEKVTVKSFTGDSIETWRPVEKNHPTGEVIRPVFQDLTELRIANRFRVEGSELDVYDGQLWGLYPPESTPQYDGKTLMVAGGVELDILNELTKGTWVEKPVTYE